MDRPRTASRPPFPAEARSAVPDLLFEDQQVARVQEIAPYLDEPEGIDGAAPLHRLTVFLTYRCNLACPYCKTIARSEDELAARPAKRESFTVDAFRRLLDGHDGTPIRHLHFTGGEATLVRVMPEMVSLARARGVERLSVTSNGTMPIEVYRALVERGIDEIRISLDAADPALGRALTLRGGAWAAAVRAVRELAAMRAAGAALFLIVNTVVGLENRARLPEIVRFLFSLGPDDIKLITEVDEKRTLPDFPDRAEVARALRELLSGHPASAFPLLRRKLDTVFAPDSIGLAGVGDEAGDFRCYIPLTERTVDAQNYYPCSVYLREGGAPLGRIDEPQDEQRRKTAAFVRRGDCLRDPICREYCLHCTRTFNVRANEARR
jgi:MoaA/NifB/PqqE/SkfB family radical SAM enzyme